MVAVPHPQYGTNTNNIGPGLTRYCFAGSIHCDWHATEANRQVIWRHNATLSGLGCAIPTNSINETSTVRIRINGANGNQVVSVAGLATGHFEDTTNSDSVTAGDKISLSCVTGATGTTFKVSNVSFNSAAASNTVRILGCNPVSGLNTDSVTRYIPIAGNPTPSATESADLKFNFKNACTLKHLQVNVQANSRNGTTTFRLRKNGADGNQTVSVSALATGWFEDTSNTDSISVNDDVNFSATTVTGGGNCVPQSITVAVETTDDSTQFVVCADPSSPVPIIAGATKVGGLGGILPNSTNELAQQHTVGDQGRFSKLQVYVSSNGVTATSTLRLRINGANGNSVVSISASSTGLFEDTSNTDFAEPDDLINYQITAGATGTELQVTNYSSVWVAESADPLTGTITATSALTGTLTVGKVAAINLPQYGIDNINVNAGVTSYTFPGMVKHDWNATEANRQVKWRHAATLSKLGIRVYANGTSGAGTFRTRINGANGSQSVSVTGSTTGYFEDTSNTDSIASGDLVSLQFVGGTGSSFCGSTMSTVVNSASSATVTKMGVKPVSGFNTDSATRYLPMVGAGTPSATETDYKQNFNVAGTIKNLFVYISANSRSSTATTIRTRKNGADGNLSVSVGASATGVFEDTSNSDTVAAGDDFAFAGVTSTGGGNCIPEVIAVEFETSNGAGQLLTCGATATVCTAGLTYIWPCGGQGANTATEAYEQVKAGIANTYEKLQVYITANSANYTSTARLRKNTANGSQSISISAGATGLFTDTTNTDAVTASDVINYNFTTGAGTGTVSVLWWGMNTQASGTVWDLAGPIDGASTIGTAALGLGYAFGGSIDGASSIGTASLGLGYTLTGAVDATSSVNGAALNLSYALSGAASAASAMGGDLTIDGTGTEWALAGAIATSAALAGQLSLAWALTGSISGSSGMSGGFGSQAKAIRKQRPRTGRARNQYPF